MTFKEAWEKHKGNVVDHTKVVDNTDEVETEHTQDIPEQAGALDILKVLPLFGMDSMDQVASKEKEMLKIIAGIMGDNLGDKIVNFESKIGTPPIGVSRIRHIYNSLMFKNAAQDSNSGQSKQNSDGDSGSPASRPIEISIRMQ